MFHYSAGKKSGQDRNKNSAKFLDAKRDTHARLKALQRLLELQPEHEVKNFFQVHSTEVFYLFYEEFTNLELCAKSKGAKLKDELEELLSLLEKIFIYLAEELHGQWQFNSIGLILRKLLHHGNVLAVREHGVKLFMLWLQILQEKVDEFHLAVFASIVPGFPSPIAKLNIEATHRPQKVIEYVISCINGQGTAHTNFTSSLESDAEWCITEGGSAICPPQQGEKVVPPEDLTKKFLDRLLSYMTTRMLEIEWNDKSMRNSSFYHIFSHFKRFYLPQIFPRWNPADRLYNAGNDIISVPITEYADGAEEEGSAVQTCVSLQCQSAILAWLITYTVHWKNKAKVGSEKVGSEKVQDTAKASNVPVKAPDESESKEAVETITNDDETLAETGAIVRAVLYATQENVLLVHEIFRQGFLMPLSCSDVMSHILNVYKEWFSKVSERPPFMLEEKCDEPLSSNDLEDYDGSESPMLRSASYKTAVSKCENIFFANLPVEKVCAGFHANLRLFIALTGQVFFVKQQQELISKHADICKKVMKHYRNIVLEKPLDSFTWRQLLIVLLKIIDHIFTMTPPNPREATLGGQLGSYLLQTLFVTWVRASLEVYLTLDLWDELLRIGSSFTSWAEMIKEWAGTMETLTRVMARTVYGIDLNDPPLNQLTQRGNLRKFKRVSGVVEIEKNNRQSFTPSWSGFHEANHCVSFIQQESAERKTLLALGKKPTTMSDTHVNRRPSSLPSHSDTSTTNVKIVEETAGTNADCFADEFVPSQASGEVSEDTCTRVESTSSEASENNAPFSNQYSSETPTTANFANFDAHFPENSEVVSTFDADSDCEFGDSESNSGESGKVMYETLNDTESVSSSLNIPPSHSLASLDSFLSESSQNLLADDYDSEQSDGRSSAERSLSSAASAQVFSTGTFHANFEDNFPSEGNLHSGENNIHCVDDDFHSTEDNFHSSEDNSLPKCDTSPALQCNAIGNDYESDYLTPEESSAVEDNVPSDSCKTENNSCQTENNSCKSENNICETENNSCKSENNSCKSESNSCKSENKLNKFGAVEYGFAGGDDEEKCESEMIISGTYSDSTYTSDEHTKSTDFLAADDLLTPLAVSGLSEQDLINFEIDLKVAARRSADNQSIDSHVFTSLIDNESFNGINSHADDTDVEIGEAPIAEKDLETLEESLGHVRFAEGEDGGGCGQGIKKVNIARTESIKVVYDPATRSVIEGGVEVGWTPVSSVILWKRILGILGDVNHIKDPEMHALVFQNLTELWQMLEMIKANQGVSMDNKSTPVPPALTPPLYFCSTWCLQAMAGNVLTSHKQGRIRGFKLMCMMIIRNHGLKPSKELMTHFFRLLHVGLTGPDQEVANAIIEECALFYTREFESGSCLFLDFIHATNTIISTQYMTYPRKDAISLLGSMICLAGAYPSMKVYQPGVRANETQHALTGKELREKILIPVLKAAKNDPSCRARCIALSSLGLFIIESLVHWKGDQKIYECLALIMSSLEFHSQTVSAVALDVLLTLTYYHKELSDFDKNLPLKIVQAMCHITSQLHSSKQSSASELTADEAPEYMSRLLLCLVDWLMVIPQEGLLNNCTDDDTQTYAGLAIKTFKRCCKKSEWFRLERRRSLHINEIFVGDGRQLRLARVHNDLSMDDPQGVTDDDDTDYFHTERNNQHENLLSLTANYCINQMLNYYQHFPFDTGAVQPVSVVVEHDDHAEDKTGKSSTLIDCDNVQFLLVNGSTLLSVGELPQVEEFNDSFEGLKTISRFLLRDISGKHCWDISGVFDIKKQLDIPCKDPTVNKKSSIERKHSRNLSVSVPRLTTSTSTQLPTWECVHPNVDRVDQLLRYIGHSSPECLLYPDQQLNLPSPVPDVIDLKAQSAVVTAVLKQHNEEENYVHEISHDTRITASEITMPEFRDPSSPYHLSKLLLHQLNYFSWENRPEIELLERNEKLLRDIKNLDKRPSRETQKIAIFYVGPGQEDKHSILSNSQGSEKFEQFLSCMAWEVDLATHTGFMGGLEKNLSTGVSAPYYANHSLELIFHVSTRMPGSEDEQLKTKLRHLGNDEIHIVWSEHNRDFRRGIINTEFGDVLIIIYPMKNNLYRIHIDRNPKIPPFGPLYDGVIIDGDVLPILVRSAVINAGRAHRTTLPFFNRHYEERARCIGEIADSRVRPSAFEQFSASVFAPCLRQGSDDDIDSAEGIHPRTFTAPSRQNSSKDSAAVLTNLLDLPEQTFRGRSSTTANSNGHGKFSVDSGSGKFYRSPSHNSLLDEDAAVFSDCDQNDYSVKSRRRSLPKRLKRKPFSMDVTHEKFVD